MGFTVVYIADNALFNLTRPIYFENLFPRLPDGDAMETKCRDISLPLFAVHFVPGSDSIRL